jgi:hypothetical protein
VKVPALEVVELFLRKTVKRLHEKTLQGSEPDA